MVAVLSVLCSAPVWGQDVIKGKVSWYGGRYHQGRKTANGEVFDKNKLTAASPLKPGTKKPVYPFGTKLKVTNLANGRSVIVTINDTGTFGKYNRLLDLSEAAFEKLFEKSLGVGDVEIRKIYEKQ